MQPISFPSRSRNPATEVLALVTSGFWPLILARLSTAASSSGLVLGGPADAHVDDDLLQLGDRHLVLQVELRRQGRGDRRVVLVEQAGHVGSSFVSGRVGRAAGRAVGAVRGRVGSARLGGQASWRGPAWRGRRCRGSALHFLQYRCFWPASVNRWPTRTPRLQRRAVEQDVRDVDRHLLGEPAPLLVLGAGLQVLVDPVDPLDDDLVLLGEDAEHLGDPPASGVPLSSPVITSTWSSLRMMHGDSLSRLGSGRVGSGQTTSAARLMIFMNWRSRSSRAMAPKMRVPRGFFSVSIRTTALRSNLT